MTDDPMDRLTAADPAAASIPDADVLRASVDERIWAGVGDELQAQREQHEKLDIAPARGWSWLTVGAAACAAVLVAGIAYSAGRNSLPETADGALSAPITLGTAQGTRDGGPVPAVSGGASAAATDRMMPYYGGRVVYVAGEGLSTNGGTADAFAYNATAVDGRRAAAALAAAVGVKGKPEQRDGSWVVGGQDGSGPQAGVQPDGMRSFYSYDPAADPNSCLKVEPQPVPESSAGSSGGSADGSNGSTGGSVPASGPTCPAVKPAPSKADSISAAKALMEDLGRDPAGFAWTAELTSGITFVSATEALSDSSTGAQWYFSYAAGLRLLSANGFLAPRIPLGSYDVVSPKAAVERLGDPRFGGYFGGPIPMAADASRGVAAAGAPAVAPASGGTVSSDVATATAVPVRTDPPTPPSAGSTIPWPVTTVTVTGCRLGWAQNYLPTGAVTLVPAYECSNADGVVASVIAVADSELDFSSAP